MRMNQDERRFDFHGLGAALKRAREEKGWTQAYVAELVDRDSRTIMWMGTPFGQVLGGRPQSGCAISCATRDA